LRPRGASGYVHPDTPSTTDPTEWKRRRAEADRREQDDKRRRTGSALAIWKERKPFRGSPAERYLRTTRRIGDWLDGFDRIDEARAYHPACPFEAGRLPCMVALVRNIQTDEPQGIHRTALKLEPSPDRIGRLSLGPIAGGAIKLSPNDEVTGGLLVGEGIETVLSASRKFQFKPVWSLISTAGLRSFPVLPGVECVTVAVDNDKAGENAAAELVQQYSAAGVEIITAKTNIAKDFNDVRTV
jgi:putative DNA primase/helicase